MFFGQFQASLIPLTAATAGTLSIVLCYYIAIYLGHQKPLPHTYISNTARHYPEFIIFRIGTISGAVLHILAAFINYFYMKYIAYQSTFNLRKYFPVISLITSVVGSCFLMGSTANIDTGKQNMHWHVFCAGNFFIWSILSVLYNTYLSYVLVGNGVNGISKDSLYVKLVLSLLIFVQLYLESYNSFSSLEEYHSSALSHYLEYTLAFSILAGIYLIAWDVRKFQLVYESKH